MATEAQLRALRKYDDKHTVQKNLKFNLKYDKDILLHIEKKNFQGYIKELIREDIKK